MAADRVREEAEKLVTAALAVLSSATRGLGGAGSAFATGSAECCVCPVCRVIAAMRDPGSDLTERLAAGVGDLATGVTAVLRLFSGWGGRAAEPEEPPTSEGDEYWENLRRKAAEAAKAYARASGASPSRSAADEDPWRVATREPADPEPSASESPAAPEPPVTPAPRSAPAAPAKKTAAKASRATKATVSAPATGAPPAPVAKKATKPMAKKATKPMAKKATKPVARRDSAAQTTAAARATGARKTVTPTIRPGGAA